MKKAACILTVLLLTFSLALPCFASTFTSIPTTDQGNVYGKYTENIHGVYKVHINDKKASVVLPDGTVIHADGAGKNGLILVVMPIEKENNPDAFQWFENTIGKKETAIETYEIYFTDDNGDRVDPESSTVVTITSKSLPASPVVYYLTSSGSSNALNSTSSDGNVIFKMVNNGYYVLAQTVDDPKSEALVAPDSDFSSPKTGEDSCNTYLWVSLFLLSTGLFVFTFRLKKENNA
jgi:LPXTG-motif cell wall-anchored protein